MKYILLATFLLSLSNITFTQDFWQQTNGPYGGAVRSFGTDWNDNIFAGIAYASAAYRSGCEKNEWIPVTNGLPFYPSDFGFDSNGVYMYAAVYFYTGGIFRSSDQGQSWEKLMNGVPGYFANTVAVSPEGSLLAGFKEGIYRSNDHGDNWISSGLEDLKVYCFAFSNDGYCYAGTGNGLYYSTDDGINWTEALNQGLTDTWINSMVVDEGRVFAGTQYDDVIMSTDHGTNWIGKHNGIVYNVNGLAIDSKKNLYASSLGGGVYISTNGGDNWFTSMNGLLYDFLYCIALDSRDHIYVGLDKGGVFKSTDKGLSWFSFNNQLKHADVFAILVDPSGSFWTGCNNNGIYYSKDNGTTWEERTNGLAYGQMADIEQNTDNVLFASTWYQGMFRSTDNGSNWVQVNNGITHTYLRKMAINSLGYIFVAADPDGAYRSTDGGDHWVNINNGLPSNKRSMDIATTAEDSLFLANYGSGVFFSTDNGDHWTARNTGMTDSGVRSLATAQGGLIFVGGNGGIFRSTNNGISWVNTLDSNTVYDMIISKNGYIYTGTNHGVFQSTDNGLNWLAINEGLTDFSVHSLAIDSSYHLLAGTGNHGVFRSVAPIVAIENNNPLLPGKIILYQNYPNPFNPNTTIKYDLPKSANVSLKIYNMLGQEVRTIVSGYESAGYKQVVWDGKNNHGNSVSSGIYLYRLEAGEFTKTMKLMLIK